MSPSKGQFYNRPVFGRHSQPISRNVWLLLVVTTFVLCGVQGLLAQGTSGELKWLRVGSLQTYLSEQNEEVESGGTVNNALNIAMSWPAQYSLEQSTMRSRTLWIGCTDFNDVKAGKVYAYKVVGVGPRYDDNLRNEVFVPPAEFRLVGKFDHPLVVVDGEIATVNTLYDVLDEVDENLIADRMIVVKNHTYLGVTITKRVYAFSQQNHDNYFVFDYVLKNTGITSPAGEVTPRTLTGFVFYLSYRYSFAGESVQGFNQGWGSWNSSWGRNTVNDVVGTDPNSANFEFRAHLAWYGTNSGRPVSLEDDWGCPNQLDDGIMAAAKYGGSVVLHADRSPRDQSDDLFQPKTTHFIDTDLDFTQLPYYAFDERFTQKRYTAMTMGHAAKTQAQQVEETGTPANEWGPGIGGSQAAQGFGPYTLEPGDSIHVVLAQGVAGISREKNREVGGNWLQYYKGNRTAELRMPDGSITTDHTAYKKAWVSTSKDSLFKTFRHALNNYGAGYAIPQPPPPPSQFTVESGGDRIRLSWASEATTAPHFNGYVIYRSEGSVLDVKTVYQKIFECDASNVVHTYDDISAVRGFDYYYYVQSKDDGTQNDVEPGRPLYSGMFWTLTNKPATLQRSAGTALDQVRVVPNPYDIRARMFQFGEDSQYDRIAFYGLPPFCTLKIFTERGDLIWEKEHDNGAGDELWDSLTSSRQIITSGIYILYVEVSEDAFEPGTGTKLFSKGDTVYRKFVVIR